jgi:hypothetical protein
MLSALLGRLTYANVMATIALFIALGGTGYAAISLPKNSVGSKQLKKGAVTPKKIKKGAVTSAAVKDGSLGAGDFAANQLPAGPKGEKGDPGAAGAPGSARAYTYLDESTCDDVGPCTLDPAETKGFSGARRTSTGVYCFAIAPSAGIDRDGAAVLTQVDWSGTSSPEGNAVVLAQDSNTDCAANEIRIRTQRHSDSAGTNAAQADFISFYIAIP